MLESQRHLALGGCDQMDWQLAEFPDYAIQFIYQKRRWPLLVLVGATRQRVTIPGDYGLDSRK